MKIKRVDDKPMVIHTKSKPVIRSKPARNINKTETSIPAVSKDPRFSGKQENTKNINKVPAKTQKINKGNEKSKKENADSKQENVESNTKESKSLPQTPAASEQTTISHKIKTVGHHPRDVKETDSHTARTNNEEDTQEKRNVNHRIDAIKAHKLKTTKTDANYFPPSNKMGVNKQEQNFYRQSSLHPAFIIGRDAMNELDGGRELNEAVQTASTIARPIINAGVAGRKLFISQIAKIKAGKRIKRVNIKGKRIDNNRRYDSDENPNSPNNNADHKNKPQPNPEIKTQPNPGKNRTPSSIDNPKYQTSPPDNTSSAKNGHKKENPVQKARNKPDGKAPHKRTVNNGASSDSYNPGKKMSADSTSIETSSKANSRGNSEKAKGGSKSQNNKIQKNKTQKGKTSNGTHKKAVRNRMIQLFIAKLKQESNQDSLIKAIKDIAMMRFSILIKKTLAFIFAKLAIVFGIIALVTLPIIVVIAIIYNSPFAILFPSISSAETTQEVLASYAADFKAKVENEASHHTGYDYSEIFYVDYEGSGTPDNYIDILAVYMVRHGIGDTATDMTPKAKQNLKAVFDDMASYSVTYGEVVKLEEVELKDEYGFRIRDEDGNIVTEWIEVTYKVKYVNIHLRTAHEMITLYSLSNQQKEILLELMLPQNIAYMGYVPSGSTGVTLTNEQIRAIVDTISDANGKKVVGFALSKVGYPYSQALRDSGTHFDCSSLTFYAWRSAGINLTYEGSNTAAQQGKYLYDNDLLVAYSDMRPGDLIFYSTTNNGRFHNITHVAIFVGSGMMVDAANSNLGVVYRPVNTRNIVFVGRPR